MTTDSYATIGEVAAHFKVSVSTVRTWLRKQLIPPAAYIKADKTYRFRMEAVERALSASRFETERVELDGAGRQTERPPLIPLQFEDNLDDDL